MGAVPERLYNREEGRTLRRMHAREDALNRELDAYRVGRWIEHPRFGIGAILAVEGEGAQRRLEADFDNAGRKRLGLKWVYENCLLYTEEDYKECFGG